MSEMLKNFDVRTGRHPTFGINVFKVREVIRTPPITAVPEMLPNRAAAAIALLQWNTHTKFNEGK